MIALLIFCLVIIGLSIAAVIVQYLCIYKTYHLFLPANAVPMLILSILFPIVFSFTVFLNRNNTPVIYNGMPPWQQNGYGGITAATDLIPVPAATAATAATVATDGT